MKSTTKKMLTIASTALALSVATVTHATNGYFSHGYGAKNKGLAGGGSALPQDAMAAASNPAGMAFIGERMDAGAAMFSPSPREYAATADGAGQADGACAGGVGMCPFTFGGNATAQSIESDNDVFLIPHFAYNMPLSGNSTYGITVYGNGGMNTEYAGGVAQHDDGTNTGTAVTTAGTFGGGTAGVNLEQLFISNTYAQKIDETSSWGASVIIAYQRFSATGLVNFSGYSSSSTNLTNNGTDDSYGFGVKLGYQTEVSPGVTIAASYQSEMDMDEFDKYSGLFAENGDFNIPSTWTVGLAWVIDPKRVLTFDIQRINYTDVAAISNPISYLVGPSNSCATGTTSRCLGASEGAGFGWEDMTIYKIGYQWEHSADWTWRVGYSFTDQPIPDSETMFNILAPAVIEEHLTVGFTHKTAADSELNLQVMYAPSNTISGASPLNASKNIALEMSQLEMELSWGFTF